MKGMKTLLLSVLLGLCLLGSFLGGANAGTNISIMQVGEVNGFVTDANTNAPIAGATVWLSGQSLNLSTTTDLRGAFRFLQVPPGIYDIGAAAQGYESCVLIGIVVDAGRVTTVDIRLMPSTPPPPIQVEVTPSCAQLMVGEILQFTAQAYDANGNPIGGLNYRWSTGGGIGTIDQQGVFTATSAGRGWVSAETVHQGITAIGSAQVVVLSGTPFSVIVTPNQASLQIKQSVQFTAQAYENNISVSAAYSWYVRGGIGFVQPTTGDTITFTATTTGYGQVVVTATYHNYTADDWADVYVYGGAQQFYVEVTPTYASLQIGSNQTFTAQAYDLNRTPVQASYSWYVRGGIGDVQPATGDATTFTATNVGCGQVVAVATYQNTIAEGWADVDVYGAGQQFYVVVTPQYASLQVGDTEVFTAQAYDMNRMPIQAFYSWYVRGGIGDVLPTAGTGDTTTFTATNPGYGQVVAVATYQNTVAEGWADVDVYGTGQQFYVLVTPRYASLQVGDTEVFTAQAYDMNRTPIQASYSWYVRGGIGDVQPATGDTTTFTATNTGCGQVVAVATYQNTIAEGWADVDVYGGGQQIYVLVTPQYASLQVGDTEVFTAQAYDMNRTPVQASYSWYVRGGIGSVNPTTGSTTTFTATTVGFGEVIVEAQYTGLVAMAAAKISVIYGQNTTFYIIVTPPFATLQVGDTMQFDAQAYDHNGNPITLRYTWSVNGQIGMITQNGLFTATYAGYGLVTAEATYLGTTEIGFADVFVAPNITGPDLWVDEFNIGFSNPTPADNENIIIYALIHNAGSEAATADVKFYDGNPGGGVLIGEQAVYVLPQFTDVAFVRWTATAGSHEIYVVIENVQPQDINTANNIASKQITVGAGQTPNLEIQFSIQINQSGDSAFIIITLTVICRQTPVHNVHIVIWDDANLNIQFSAINIDLRPGQRVEFTLLIRVTIPSGGLSKSILVQAAGDESRSGIAQIPIELQAPIQPPVVGFWTAGNIILVAIGIGAGVGTALAVFFRRRH